MEWRVLWWMWNSLYVTLMSMINVNHVAASYLPSSPSYIFLIPTALSFRNKRSYASEYNTQTSQLNYQNGNNLGPWSQGDAMGEIQRLLYVQSSLSPAPHENDNLSACNDPLCGLWICRNSCSIRYLPFPFLSISRRTNELIYMALHKRLCRPTRRDPIPLFSSYSGPQQRIHWCSFVQYFCGDLGGHNFWIRFLLRPLLARTVWIPLCQTSLEDLFDIVSFIALADCIANTVIVATQRVTITGVSFEEGERLFRENGKPNPVYRHNAYCVASCVIVWLGMIFSFVR